VNRALAMRGAYPCDFAGVVLIDCVKSHQGVEQKQPGPKPLGRLEQPLQLEEPLLEELVAQVGHGERDGRAQRGLQRHRRLVEPRVGQGQRGEDDQERMREGREDLGHHEADRSVDAVAEEQSLDQPLIAEEVDEREPGQERGHEDGDERHRLEESAQRHAGARERVGVNERRRHGDDGAEDRDPEAVADRLEEGRRREVAREVCEADEVVPGALQALAEHEPERQRQGDDQIERDDADEDAHEPIVAARLGPDDRDADVGGGRDLRDGGRSRGRPGSAPAAGGM